MTPEQVVEVIKEGGVPPYLDESDPVAEFLGVLSRGECLLPPEVLRGDVRGLSFSWAFGDFVIESLFLLDSAAYQGFDKIQVLGFRRGYGPTDRKLFPVTQIAEAWVFFLETLERGLPRS